MPQEKRIVEAYVGEYASGKSEAAICRALACRARRQPVTLVDFDLVEPCYTLRAIKPALEAAGLAVLAWASEETVGLGEAGMTLLPAARWALRRPGDIIIDVGYGVHGARTLDLLAETKERRELKIIAVINTARPLTADLAGALRYVQELGPVDALLNNTHIGRETTAAMVEGGALLTAELGRRLGVPVVGSMVQPALATRLNPDSLAGQAIWIMGDWMQHAFW